MPTNPFIASWHLNGTAASYRGVVVAGSSSTDLSAWKVALYNVTTGVLVNTYPLGATSPQGFTYINLYGVANTNNANMGLALVNPSGSVVEFVTARLSTSTAPVAATSGPANGMVPTITNTALEASGTATGVWRTGTGSVAEDFTWQTYTSGWVNGSVAQTGQTYVVADTTPPAPVSGLALSTVTSTSIRVYWSNPADSADWTGTGIYVAGTKVADLGSSYKQAAEYTVTGLEPSTTYTIGVWPYDAVGNHPTTPTVEATTSAPDPDPDPDPDPEPEPEPITGLPADVVAFMGRTGDPGVEALAAEHVPVMAELVNAYVRGKGPVRTGLGLGEFSFPPDLRAVVITASARLIANPAQLESESADGYAARGAFVGFSLAEQAILHLARYRRRVA